VASRGEVLRLKARLGFGAKGQAEPVVVAQADDLNRILPTLLIVPLDPAAGLFAGHPIVRVSAQEAGSSVEHVADATQLRAVREDALAPGVVGRLRPETLAELNRLLLLVLGI
jgi:mRNA-degrading endonuclease toxin of MazEF toxin-antitoxin module